MEAFWSTDYGQTILTADQTEIDRLLSSPDSATLEDFFDEDELLQQCSNKNTLLINFLSKQENITKLVSYITRPWQEHMTHILNHLKQQNNTQNNPDKLNNDNIAPSPLSKNGIHRVNSIKEEAVTDTMTVTVEDVNSSDATVTDPDPSTPEAVAQTLMNLEQKTNVDDMDIEAIKPDKSDIFSQIIDDNIPTNDMDMDIDIDIGIEEDDEFNDANYVNLRLSDDEEDDQQQDEEDDDEDETTNDGQTPPKLKKKGSIVDMLMDGPEYNDDTELDDKTNENEDNDADPELPDLDVKKMESDKDATSPNGSNNNESTSQSQEEKPPIFDPCPHDIPPPPPPPSLPSKLEEFKSEIGIEKVKLKYPYIASEIINCQIPQILDTILNEDNPFLDMLFDFIQESPPLNAVLTNYWRSCIVGLVRRNSTIILAYIKSRENLLSSLVQHIRDQSIMELVIALGWDPAIEELKELDEVADWMYKEELVPKLIATLSPTHTPDEHSAASYTLVDIVAKTSRSTNLVLFYNLASEEQIDALMNHMFAGNRSSLLESLSVLLALLHHYPNVSAEKQQFGDDDHEERHGDDNEIPPPPATEGATVEVQNENPLAPKQSTSNDQTNGNGAAKADELTVNPLAINQAENAQVDLTNNAQPGSAAETVSATATVEEHKFDGNVPSVVRAVCLRLSEFKVLLEDDNLPDLQLPFVLLSPPLGPVRHKVVDMIVALMRTPSTVVSQKLRSLGLIVKCIELFFLYPWNNLLHGSVEHIIQMVVSGDCSVLKAALFEDCDFLNRILKARELSAQHQEKSGFRLGYMGHITRVSNTIVEFAKRNKQLLEYMEKNEDWMKFIADDLKLENEQLNTQLGGHRPSALNGEEDVDDFTLFTLNDISNHTDDNDHILNDDETSEEVEEDNDSDSDEDTPLQGDNDNADNTQNQSLNETNVNYEMPQDAFTKLTQKIDESEQQKPESNANGNDDFDQWLNDEENWNDFGDENKANTSQNSAGTEINGDVNMNVDVNKKEAEKQEKKQNEKCQSQNEDFDNWDNPFAEDDLFENDGEDKSQSDKLNNGHINAKIEQQIPTVVAVND